MRRAVWLLLGMAAQAIGTSLLALFGVVIVGPVVQIIEGGVLLYVCLAIGLASRVPRAGPRDWRS
jgi:hypothetical protein